MMFEADQHSKLRRILTSGGPGRPPEVVEARIAPPAGVAEARWRQLLTDHRTVILRAAASICDPSDAVNLKGDVLTVYLHPEKWGRKAEVEARLLGAISSAMGVEGGRTIHRFDSVEFDLSALPVPLGHTLTFHSGRTAGALPLVFVSIDRNAASNGQGGNLELDVASLTAAAQVAFKCLRLKIGDERLRVLFPAGIDNLRKPAARDRLMFELRQVPDPVLARMQPVIVRLDAGDGASDLTTPLSALERRFDTIWTLGRADSPAGDATRRPDWGVVVDATSGSASRDAGAAAWLEWAEREEVLVAFLRERTAVRR